MATMPGPHEALPAGANDLLAGELPDRAAVDVLGLDASGAVEAATALPPLQEGVREAARAAEPS